MCSWEQKKFKERGKITGTNLERAEGFPYVYTSVRIRNFSLVVLRLEERLAAYWVEFDDGVSTPSIFNASQATVALKQT